MKVLFIKQRSGAKAPGQRALTLVEMMIAMSIFGLVVAALVYGHLFGQRYDQLVSSKLGASEHSRRAFDLLSTEFRSAKIWQVGNGSQTSFTPCGNGTLQQGNALQFSFNTNASAYVRYYFDTGNNLLCRVQLMENGGANYTVIADNLTNSTVFNAEDYSGAAVTDLSYKYVVHFVLQFSQYQFPLTKVGPGYLYDYYKLEFKVTPHCPD